VCVGDVTPAILVLIVTVCVGLRGGRARTGG
jgi:hypothetical protein